MARRKRGKRCHAGIPQEVAARLGVTSHAIYANPWHGGGFSGSGSSIRRGERVCGLRPRGGSRSHSRRGLRLQGRVKALAGAGVVRIEAQRLPELLNGIVVALEVIAGAAEIDPV